MAELEEQARQILERVRRTWQVVGVYDEEGDEPAFAYTVGLGSGSGTPS